MHCHSSDLGLKRAFGPLVSVLALVSLFPAALAQVYGGTLHAAFTTETGILDTYLDSKAVTRNIAHHVFDLLVTYNEAYDIVPGLAQSWEVSDDGTVYTFALRPGIRFHDGSEVQAADVKASIERMIDIGLRGGTFANVSRVDEVSSFIVRVELNEAEGAFLSKLASPASPLVIMPARLARVRDALAPPNLVGTGPYVIAEQRPGQFVRLERFVEYTPLEVGGDRDGYAGTRVPYFDTIVFHTVTEAGSRMASLEAGEYHFAEDIPTTSTDRVRNSADLIGHVLKPKWKIVARINHATGLFSDPRARRGLVVALDFDDIMRGVTAARDEYWRTQPSIFFNEQVTWHADDISEDYNNQSPELARELFAAAGYAGEELVFVCNRDFDWMYRAALGMQEQLRAIGVNVRLEMYDWPASSQVLRQVDGWHLGCGGQSIRLDPDGYADSLLHGFTNNITGDGYYRDEEVEELVRAGSRETDPEVRRELYTRIQEILWRDVIWLPIGDLFELEVTRSSVQNYEAWYGPRFWNVWFE